MSQSKKNIIIVKVFAFNLKEALKFLFNPIFDKIAQVIYRSRKE